MKKSICGLLRAIMVIGTVTVHAGEPSQIILSEYERFGFAMIRL